MSDTPETDSKASEIIGFFSCATVPADFARDLERQRDKAIHGASVNYNFTQEARCERDQARELLRLTEEFSQLLCDELNETVTWAATHGWRSSRYEQGKDLREKIQQLKEGAK